MVAFADVVQFADRLEKMVDAVVPALKSSLPSLEQASREALQRAISDAAATAQQAAPATMAVSTEVSLDVVVAKLDPTSALDPRTFTVEGANGHPWLKEDLAHLTHATTEKERHDREQGPTMMHPLPPMPNLAAWASPEPPRMRDGAQRQSRHPFIKF